MIDVALRLQVADGRRAFTLDVAFASASPVVALYGPSGAGKSLTLQAMAGLLRPQAGHVRMGARTLFDAARGIDVPAERRGVGYLFQDYALFPHLSVRDNVAFGLTNWRRRLSHDDAERVDTLIDGFGLQGLQQARPALLSGGQRQRVALARALACRPQALLLDEPFAALNPLLRQQLRDELRVLQQRLGIPVVLITHDADDVLALAQTAFVVDEGHVLREVDLVAEQPRERGVERLLGAAPAPPDARRTRLLDWLGGRAAA